MNVQQLRKRVKVLQKKPQPEQRTPEWFAARQTRITASEAASCLFKSERMCKAYVEEFNLTNFKYKDNEPLNPYETKQDYIIKKCTGFYGTVVFKDTPHTLWGKKYEEAAQRLYCQLNNTSVIEFGLLPHSRLKWLAASPDGITPDGIMLEIKCPKSRKLDPSAVPLYYWVQTQIQLETADLEHCDFLECEMEEALDFEDWMSRDLLPHQHCGVLMRLASTGSEPKYIYPAVEVCTKEQYIEWIESKIKDDNTLTPEYYFITNYNNIRVKRSKEWFAAVRDDIKSTWDIIMRLQGSKEEFDKYKASIDAIKNQKFFDKYHSTSCMIEDDLTTFVVNSFIDQNVEEEQINDDDTCMIE